MNLRLQCLTLIALFSMNEICTGQIVSWQSFTSVGEIRDIAVGTDGVWAASNGGVSRLTFGDTLLSQFTNTNGLSQNNVAAVVLDKSGAVWFAMQNGLLNRFMPEESGDDAWLVIEDYKDQVISDLVAFGDSLFVGLDFGVSLFLADKLEVKETYQNMGLGGQDVEKIAVNSISTHEDKIWVATPRGLAQSFLMSGLNLQAPANWTKYKTTEGLPSNDIRAVAVLDGVPFAATSQGAARLVDGTWVRAGLDGQEVRALISVEAGEFSTATLLSITAGGVFRLTGTESWENLGGALTDVTAIKAGRDGSVWIGRRNLGIAGYDFENSRWELLRANAPSSNNFKALTLDSKGNLWCASQLTTEADGGVQRFDGQNWTRISGLRSRDYRTIVEDSEGRIWAGSWGGGIAVIEETDSGLEVTNIDTSDGTLSGFVGDPAFVLVPGLVRDPQGNVLLINRQAISGLLLVGTTPGQEYIYFPKNTNSAACQNANFRADGIISPFLTAIAVDLGGRIWLGSEDCGVQVVDFGPNISDPTDDTFHQGIKRQEGLFSSNITALAEDRDGTMWIGTDAGLNLWFDGITADESNTPVNAIGVDPVNNKWIGTSNGISIYRGHRDKLEDVIIGNSGLVSENVLSFAFNGTTGEVWIGTDNGLSLAQTLFTAPKDDFNEITGYPNPFIISGSDDSFTIDKIRGDATIGIYNAAGRLIAETSANGTGRAFWDGRDLNQKLVASGIYVYLAYTSSGISARGKVAVIRR